MITNTNQGQKSLALLLDGIEQRASLVTPGPWKQARSAVYDKVEADGKVICFIGMSDIAWQLADFIAASRTDLPLLVKALRRAMQALEEKEAVADDVEHVRQKLRDARSLSDAYTFAKPCCVSDTPDAHTVWIKVGNQSFSIDGYQDTLAEANWMRLMLGKAIQAILSEHFNAAGAPPGYPKVLPEITAILEGKEQEPKALEETRAAHTKEPTSDS